jgi:hypothetical protein
MKATSKLFFGHALQPVLSPVEAGQAVTTRFADKNGKSSNKPFHPSCKL